MFSQILPNIVGPILVIATLGVAWAILLEASLSFLGLGVQPPTPSWGGMLSAAREQLLRSQPARRRSAGYSGSAYNQTIIMMDSQNAFAGLLKKINFPANRELNYAVKANSPGRHFSCSNKFEIRISKFETNSKFQFYNDPKEI